MSEKILASLRFRFGILENKCLNKNQAIQTALNFWFQIYSMEWD